MAYQKTPFARKKPSLRPQLRVLVICEDAKSSLNYLRDAARHFKANAEVEIAHLGKTNPIGIVNQAIKKQREYEHVYCTIDRDNHLRFDEALALAKLHAKITVIASYPCYEFWLLLHFRTTTKPYVLAGTNSACDLLVADLRQEVGMGDYNKGGATTLFDDLLDRLPHAEQRAT
jgi:RloB-like protein